MYACLWMHDIGCVPLGDWVSPPFEGRGVGEGPWLIFPEKISALILFFARFALTLQRMMENLEGEKHRQGRIEVICGSMFSGKTEELIRRLKRAKFARQRVEIFKPAIDTRYSDEDVVSHDQNSIQSTPIDSSSAILLLGADIDVVGIDEAQFFDNGLVDVCNQLANSGVRVIVAGLDMDFQGRPFGPIPGLLAVADEVTKVHAICVRCGALAYVSHRLVRDSRRVMLGEKMEYEPLCRDCYQKALEQERALAKDK